MKIHNYRQQYSKFQLLESNLPSDPLAFFELWFQEALSNQVVEANAMMLSTVADKRPSARIVLLKEVSKGGFVFFTNYKSRKGQELASNPFATLSFFWPELERQVRIEGVVEFISAEESDEYFNSRPFESRISAIASSQSEVVASREEFESKLESLHQNPETVKRPSHWGGYRLIPDCMEFWQGRPNRLHDRIRYRKDAEQWLIERLAP